MKLNKNLVERLEILARIELSSDSIHKITSQLETIVSYVDQLAEVDTTGVQPADRIPPGVRGPLRKDDVRPGISQQDALAQAPDAAEDFFRVPRVIDREGGR